MIVQLSDLAGDLADLPALQAVFGVQHQAMLLLELPQLRVHVERAPEVRLPLTMAVLRQIPART